MSPCGYASGKTPNSPLQNLNIFSCSKWPLITQCATIKGDRSLLLMSVRVHEHHCIRAGLCLCMETVCARKGVYVIYHLSFVFSPLIVFVFTCSFIWSGHTGGQSHNTLKGATQFWSIWRRFSSHLPLAAHHDSDKECKTKISQTTAQLSIQRAETSPVLG